MTHAVSDLARKGMLTNPGDHFSGRYEVELKFAVKNLDQIRETLEAQDAVPFVLGNEETDVFLDWPDGRLAQRDQSQVLRAMRPSGRVLWISKGPAKDECVAMDLADFDAALNILHSLGFTETATVKKRRDIYFLGAHHITLDDVDGLGTYAEVAAMTDDKHALKNLRLDVMKTAETLGLVQQALVHKSYRDLLSDLNLSS